MKYFLFIFFTIFFLSIHTNFGATSSSSKDVPPKPVSTGVKTSSKNILFFLGMTIYSHRLSIWPLVTELSNQGHNVTVMSSLPPKPDQADPRIHEFVSETLANFTRTFVGDSLLNVRLGGFDKTQFVWNTFLNVIGLGSVEKLAEDDEFLEWMKNSQFDLVFTDAACDFGLALGHKFRAKTIIFSTTSPYPWQPETTGGPIDSSIPDMQYAFEEVMTFSQRVVNVLRPVWWHLTRKWSYFPNLENILRNKMGMTDLPPMEELESNVQLIFVNSHYAEDYARSLPPKIIYIGGLHCNQLDNREVSESLINFMDQSGGFIYISFGSAAQMSKIPVHLRQMFFNVMAAARTKFVVKWDGDVPEDLPKNVFPAKWLPQQRVLGHPNARAFMSHGGLLGTQEAVSAGVPIIYLPIFGEQDFNANRHVARGTAIKLLWEKLTQPQLEEAISKILDDPSYKKNMEKMSKLFFDRPQSPLETAVWWTDYVLRHDDGDLRSMQPLGIWQTWFERRALDVWFTVFVTIFLVLLGLFKVVRVLFHILGKKIGGATKVHESSRNDRQKKEK